MDTMYVCMYEFINNLYCAVAGFILAGFYPVRFRIPSPAVHIYVKMILLLYIIEITCVQKIVSCHVVSNLFTHTPTYVTFVRSSTISPLLATITWKHSRSVGM